MPSFQHPMKIGQKRKHENQNTSPERRQILNHSAADGDMPDDPTKVGEQYWMAQWRMPQYKKNKTWDGDGILVLSGGKGILYNMDNQIIASGKPYPDGACIGTVVTLDTKEVLVEYDIPKLEFTSGRVFGKGTYDLSLPDIQPKYASSEALSKKFIPLRPIILNTTASHHASGPVNKRHIEFEPVNLLGRQNASSSNGSSARTSYWTARWRRPQHKKNKTWEDDGFVIHADSRLTMVSSDGRLIGSVKYDGVPLHSGCNIRLSGKEVELEDEVSSAMVPRIRGRMLPDVPFTDEEDDFADSGYPMSELRAVVSPFTFKTDKYNDSCQIDPDKSLTGADPIAKYKKFVVPTSVNGNSCEQPRLIEPLHDPEAEGAVIMKAPPREHQKKFNIKNRPVVPVVVDPILGRHLRPHQKEGVKFMYECVMGFRKHEGQGCILADEMGMGKTLQTITLVWTLLKQTPYAGGGPTIGKALIVCPVSLISNWKKEFHKWLGKDRVGIFTGDKEKSVIKQFLNSKIHQVLVIGYERLRSVIADLSYCMPPIGLIICDEGHRLKSANNKTSLMFEALKTTRRIILSGTPIQNDLSEFHAMADFCNPGLLDDHATFRRVFENPILKGRVPGCSAKELELGEARHSQLQFVAKSFVLRRDASILSNYLPPKHEYVVFVAPSTLQRTMFKCILQPEMLTSLLRDSMARSLAMIQLLTKLSNSPVLFKAALEKQKVKTNIEDESLIHMNRPFEDALKLMPVGAELEDIQLSGKLTVLSKILHYIRHETKEKCILVSHYTSTLNVIEAFCKKSRYTYLRLDGQTPVNKRQEYVDSFNRAPQSGAFLFLLSSKAGGVGLNLIGASRLCLIDSDWNPSHDLQSMARIHRDGQKRPVFIYRLLTAGTIDEKIYQRQVTKLGLSESLMGKGGSESGGKTKSDSFTKQELCDLFTFHNNTQCHTHELLCCSCTIPDDLLSGDGELDVEDSDAIGDELGQANEAAHLGFQYASLYKPEISDKSDKALAKKRKAELASLGEWTHISCSTSLSRPNIQDEVLQSIVNQSEYQQFSSINTDLDNYDHVDIDDKLEGSICFLFEKISNSTT